jgi:hypothetical protein
MPGAGPSGRFRCHHAGSIDLEFLSVTHARRSLDALAKTGRGGMAMVEESVNIEAKVEDLTRLVCGGIIPP